MTGAEEQNAGAVQHERIARELAAIEGAPAFVRSPVMRRLLRFIVTESMEGRGGQIKSYTLAVDGLGRPEDFDAQQDSYPRVQMGRLRKALDSYYQENRPVNGLKLDLRPGGYEIYFTEVGDAAEAATREHWLQRWRRALRHRLTAMVFGALCIVLLVLLIAKGWVAPWGSGDIYSDSTRLEAAPLVDFQPISVEAADGVDENMADWMNTRLTEGIIATHWVRLRSAGAGSNAPASEPADYLFRNSTFVEQGQVHLTIELVENATGLTLWTYTATLPASQEGRDAELRDSIGYMVNAALGPIGAVGKRTLQGLEGKSPKPGYSCLVYAAQFMRYRYGINFNVAERCLKRTLEVNSRNGEAWAYLAYLQQEDKDYRFTSRQRNAGEIEKEIASAVVLSPDNGSVQSIAAYIYLRQGRYHMARDAALKSYALNPYSGSSLSRVANVLYFLGDAEGLEIAKAAIKYDVNAGPWFRQPLFFDALIHGRTAELQQLTATMPELSNMECYDYMIRAIAAAAAGNGALARQNWQMLSQSMPAARTDPQYVFDRSGITKPYGDAAIAVLRESGALN